MLRRLLPRDEDFFSLFERHAALTVDGAKQFAKLAGGGENVKAMAARIKEIEHEADVIREKWEDLKACVERFVISCEKGHYRLASKPVVKQEEKKKG